METHRRFFVWLSAVCGGILLLYGVGLYLGRGHQARSCSAIKLRPSSLNAWEAVLAPAQPVNSVDASFFASTSLQADDEEFVFSYPNPSVPENPFAYQLYEMDFNETLELGRGHVHFEIIGTTYLDGDNRGDDAIPFRFYDPNLDELNRADVSHKVHQRTSEERENFDNRPFPFLQLLLRHPGVEGFHFHSLELYDARTRFPLGGGYSSMRYDDDGDSRLLQMQVAMWHRGPVDLVIEFSYGPAQTIEFAPEIGEGIDGDDFSCRLVQVLQGVRTNGYATRSQGSHVDHVTRRAEKGKGGTRFLLLCYPAAQNSPVSFEFIPVEGKSLNGRGTSTSRNLHVVSFDNPLSDIERIRAHYRRQRARVIVHLPYLPGLPEVNDAVDDLQDVTLPYITFSDVSSFSSGLPRILQFGQGRRTGPVPLESFENARFPMEFHDVRVRELVELYARGGNPHL